MFYSPSAISSFSLFFFPIFILPIFTVTSDIITTFFKTNYFAVAKINSSFTFILDMKGQITCFKMEQFLMFIYWTSFLGVMILISLKPLESGF